MSNEKEYVPKRVVSVYLPVTTYANFINKFGPRVKVSRAILDLIEAYLAKDEKKIILRKKNV